MKKIICSFGLISTVLLLIWLYLTMCLGESATAVITAVLASVSWNA